MAELAEFNENIPLDDGDSRDQEEEELSRAEQEIAALVEQVVMIFMLVFIKCLVDASLKPLIIMYNFSLHFNCPLIAHSHRAICHEFP